MTLSILSYGSGPLVEVSVQVLCPFFNWVICLLGVELYEFFMYFGDHTLVQGIIGKYIFPYCWFPFHFANVFFSLATFYFDEVPFVYSERGGLWSQVGFLERHW